MTNQLTKYVKLNELLNACIVLAQTTGPTIQSVLQSGKPMKTMQKGMCKIDICTEADLRIQKTIQHNLK